MRLSFTKLKEYDTIYCLSLFSVEKMNTWEKINN